MKLTAACVFAGGLLLAGCGKDKPAEQATGPSPAGPAATTVQCDTVPEFVPLYADAQVTGCFKAASTVRPNHDSGSIIYFTKAAPAVILAWYKDQASIKGLTDNLSTDTMYSARDGEKRTMMVMTGPPQKGAGGAQVTINWGADKGV